jgi:hypothetical protein
MRGFLLVAVVAPAGLVASPGEAVATEMWCVDPTGTSSAWSCVAGATCENPVPFATIDEAFSGIVAQAAAAPSSQPATAHICVMNPGVHVENVLLDNSTGTVTSEVIVDFPAELERTWCPETSGPPDTPGFDIRGPTSPFAPRWSVLLYDIEWDGGACVADSSLLRVSAADVTVQPARILAPSAPGPTSLVQFEPSLSEATVTVWASRVESGRAPFATGPGSVILIESEISGFGVEGASLLDVTNLVLDKAAIFGNVTSGAPLVRISRRLASSASLIAANLVLGSHALLHASFDHPEAELRLATSTVSRNRMLASGVYSMPGPVVTPLSESFDGAMCLPRGADGLDYLPRQVPTSGAAPSGAPIIHLAVGTVPGSTRQASILSTFVVENESGPVVGVDGPASDLDVVVLHATSPGDVLDALGTAVGGRFVSARNLYLTPPTVALPPSWSAFEATLDGSEGAWAAPGAPGLFGPHLAIPTLAEAFRPISEVTSWGACQRIASACPDLVNACGDLAAHSPGVDCALDASAGYIPTEAFAKQFAQRFPWRGTVLDVADDGSASNVLGATGAACLLLTVPFDRFSSLVGFEGDGDGFTNLVDCDNADSNRVPALPEFDGFSSSYCDEDPDGCYRCPEASQPVPGDDDAGHDDSGVGDDDSGAAGDDDSVPTSSPWHPRAEGCRLGPGCGASWGGELAFSPLLAARRRRR